MSLVASRRAVLTSAVLGLPALLKAANSSDTYWDLVRNHFPFTESRVPMNAANLCPSVRAVSERVAELTRDIDVDCSFHNREKFKKFQEESRARIAGQLGASADEIALVRNAGESRTTSSITDYR